jgi:hypothetical protein
MAEAVVDRLEMISVDDQQRARALGLPAAGAQEPLVDL